MGKVRRGGYMFIWWIGDHPSSPHSRFRQKRQLITRVNLETMQPMDIPKIERKILELIQRIETRKPIMKVYKMPKRRSGKGKFSKVKNVRY